MNSLEPIADHGAGNRIEGERTRNNACRIVTRSGRYKGHALEFYRARWFFYHPIWMTAQPSVRPVFERLNGAGLHGGCDAAAHNHWLIHGLWDRISDITVHQGRLS